MAADGEDFGYGGATRGRHEQGAEVSSWQMVAEVNRDPFGQILDIGEPIPGPKCRRKSKWDPVAKVSGTAGHTVSKVEWPTAADDDLQSEVVAPRSKRHLSAYSSHSPSQRRSSAQSTGRTFVDQS
jgi:hypothetical protein